MASRRLLKVIDNSLRGLSMNERFAADVKSAVVSQKTATARKPSAYYKPSSLTCIRNMYFTRTETEPDVEPEEYNSLGMADTGTRRHEAIQEALLFMKDHGFAWEYVDVADYIAKKQAEGKCMNLEVKGVAGAETHLIDNFLKLSFRCDGIMRYIPTDEYFLFEFKNTASFSYRNAEFHILPKHNNQVVCYCMELDLDKAFVLYENRDTCEINCPETYIVTDEMKEQIRSLLLACESYVENMQVPPKPANADIKLCRYCPYKTACRRY